MSKCTCAALQGAAALGVRMHNSSTAHHSSDDHRRTPPLLRVWECAVICSAQKRHDGGYRLPDDGLADAEAPNSRTALGSDLK